MPVNSLNEQLLGYDVEGALDKSAANIAVGEAAALGQDAKTADGECSCASEPASGLLSLTLVFDIAASMLAFHWVLYDLDWDDFNSRAMKSCYTVIFLSVLRVVVFLLKTPSVNFVQWLCVSSMCFAAAAFSFTAGVRCISLAVYYSLQVSCCYAEQKIANHFVWNHRLQFPSGDPMKVLIVSDYFPPQRHGISTHTHGLVKALRAKGCRVHVFTTTAGEDESPDETFLTWSIVNPWNSNARVSLFPTIGLIRAVLFGDWDVVHIIFPSLIPWPVLLCAWLAGKPIYVSQHCSETLGRVYTNCVLYHMGLALYMVWSALPVWLFATLNAAPTHGFIRTNMVMKHFASERVAIIPSSVDDALFYAHGRTEDRAKLAETLELSADDGRRLWLLVSRLAPEKDIFELLHGLRHHVREASRDGRHASVIPLLVIVGDGPQRGALEKFVEQEDLPVRFLGFVPHREVGSLYRACDVCVTNSVHETFGLTVIESLASGCPMVMPRCDVFDELYGDVLGDWMYEKGDVAALARALEYASSPEAREHLAGLRSERRFNPNLCWSWNEAAVEQLAQYQRCQSTTAGKFTIWISCFGTKKRFDLPNLLVGVSVLTMCAICLVYGP